MVEVYLKPRTEQIADLVDACAINQITYSDLCKQVAAMGFKTDNLYYMVRHVRQQDGKVF